MSRKIHLYTPYYLSEDYERQKEIELCLKKNVECDEIDRIFLMVDDGHRPTISSDKITIIDIAQRPSYRHWIDETFKRSTDAISVLANSDIYVDTSIRQLETIFKATPYAFTAISRYEVIGETVTLHKSPQWSQDVWAIDGAMPLPDHLYKNLDIQLGVPRCDNKICYVFSLFGYEIFNPCHHVKTYHIHETQLRSYDINVDKRILGGTAWIHPCETLSTPSKMIFDICTLKPKAMEKIQIDDTIVSREARGLGATKRKVNKAIIGYDRNWQFPAITEQHAYQRLVEDLPPEVEIDGVIYFAFPWATLFDNMLHNAKFPAKTAFLKDKLASFKGRLSAARRVVTTCQHIRMMQFQPIFEEMGITDIFWSHAVHGQQALPEFPNIAVHPFPLYPVQAVDVPTAGLAGKKHLYSFVGAKATKSYLTNARTIIIDELSKTNTGFIAGNDHWHYNKVVYDHQVQGSIAQADNLVDESASERFRRNLLESVFSLCPSGTGPNSIRLWESLGLGAIPVILADTLALPGDPQLWQEAAVFCKEDRASILALPEVLRKIHADPAALAKKRAAMERLWSMYGAQDFVYDIRALILAQSDLHRSAGRAAIKAPSVPGIAQEAQAPKAQSAAILSQSLGSLTTDVLLSPEKVAPRLRSDRQMISDLIAKADQSQRDTFYRALKLKDLDQIWGQS